MNHIEQFYNKFNEDNRLKARRGQVEYAVTMHYITGYVKKLAPATIVDIGAGTGAYSLPLLASAKRIIAIDMVRYNLGRLRQNASKLDSTLSDKLTCMQRNAKKLREVDDNISDMTLLLGPMYHLMSLEERRQALSEAIRITRPGGVIFVAYIMNEYAILMHGFLEHTILDDIASGRVDKDYKIIDGDNIYAMVRLEDIDDINADMSVTRDILFSPDGAANHMRHMLNSLSEEEFEEFIKYQISVSARSDLLGAGAHLVDVLSVDKH